MRILLVEDDPHLGDGLCIGLRQAGHAVDWARNGEAADLSLKTEDFDLLVLDLGLPRLRGMEVLRRLRQRGQTLPVLILTAQDRTDDKVSGLDAGADDYLAKPFGVAELLARTRALLRRAERRGGEEESSVAFGDVVVDLARRSVIRAGEEVRLTPREYHLLTTLIAHRGRVLTQRQLLIEVWGQGHGEDGHYLRIYVGRLRHKLEADPARPRHLLTELGVGYRFKG